VGCGPPSLSQNIATMTSFPKQFFWGASTSSHQVEGGTYNDWSEWEEKNAPRLTRQARKKWTQRQQEKFPEMFDEKNYISGRACDHYNRYEEDFDIAQRLGHNAHRLSLEWSRIEPEKGKFDEKELEHYKNVIAALKKRGLEPFVTLWHWTLPLWVRDKGGWQSSRTVRYFSRYAEAVAGYLKNDVKFWVTVNEPEMYAHKSYLIGVWPPQKRNPLLLIRVLCHLASAHQEAYECIKRIAPQSQVGIAKQNIYFEAHPNNTVTRAAACVADWWWNHYFLRRIRTYQDFIGLNYYFHRYVWSPPEDNAQNVSDMERELYPEGIYPVLKELACYDKPIYITENGLADINDTHREWYIRETSKHVRRAIEDGVDVRGYFHWSLLDNFEWDKGFWPRFGLVEVDYTTMKRTVRKSAEGYKTIIENASAR